MTSYTVFKGSDGNYKAKDDMTGIKKSGPDGRFITQWAFDNLTPGRTEKEIVTIDTDIILEKTIYIPSYTILEIKNNRLLKLKTDLQSPIDILATRSKDPGNSNHDIEIIGGILDGSENYYRTGPIDASKAGRDRHPWYGRGIFVGRHIAKNISIRNVCVRNTVRGNITIEGTTNENSNILIDNCKLENSLADHWVYMSNGHGITIQNSEMSGFTAGEGIAVGQGDVSESIIQNNHIYDIKQNPNNYGNGYCIGFRKDSGSEQVKIINNTLELGNEGYFDVGIAIRTSTKPGKENIIAENKIIGNVVADSIIMIGRSGIIIEKNTIRETEKRGIKIDTGAAPIKGGIPSMSIDNIKILDNNLCVADRAITLIANNANISNILIDNNELNAYCGQWTYEIEKNSGILSGIKYSNNRVYGKKKIIKGIESNNMIIDPCRMYDCNKISFEPKKLKQKN